MTLFHFLARTYEQLFDFTKKNFGFELEFQKEEEIFQDSERNQAKKSSGESAHHLKEAIILSEVLHRDGVFLPSKVTNQASNVLGIQDDGPSDQSAKLKEASTQSKVSNEAQPKPKDPIIRGENGMASNSESQNEKTLKSVAEALELVQIPIVIFAFSYLFF